MTQSLSEKVIIDKLAVEFELVNTFKTIGAHLSHISSMDHVELRVLAKEMEIMELPTGDQCKNIRNLER